MTARSVEMGCARKGSCTSGCNPRTPGPTARVNAGTSGDGLELVLTAVDRTCFALFGPAGPDAPASRRAQTLVDGTLARSMGCSYCLHDVWDLLHEAAHDADNVLRRMTRVGEAPECGSLVMGSVRAGKVRLVWTARCAGYLVRNGVIIHAEEGESTVMGPPNARHQPFPAHPYAGGRAVHEPRLSLRSVEWDIEPGDRLIVSALPLMSIVSSEDLARHASHGPPETVASALATVASWRRSTAPTALIVMELLPASAEFEAVPTDEILDGALASLEELLPLLDGSQAMAPVASTHGLTRTGTPTDAIRTDGDAPPREYKPRRRLLRMSIPERQQADAGADPFDLFDKVDPGDSFDLGEAFTAPPRDEPGHLLLSDEEDDEGNRSPTLDALPGAAAEAATSVDANAVPQEGVPAAPRPSLDDAPPRDAEPHPPAGHCAPEPAAPAAPTKPPRGDVVAEAPAWAPSFAITAAAALIAAAIYLLG